MKKYAYGDSPLRIDGVPFFYEHGRLGRYSPAVLEAHPRLKEFDRRMAGVRLRFAIKGSRLKVTVKTENFYHDRGMSFYQVNCAYLFTGPYPDAAYRLLLSNPEVEGCTQVFGEIDLPEERTEVTVYLPRNPDTVDVFIETDDEAEVFAPGEYSGGAPFVFYGSSITECGITAPQNSYAALLSRWFDTDFYNLGASGNARGEPEMADYLASIPMGVFIMDYDHNAPTPEWLRETHAAFFARFREKCPDTPVIMSSRPSDDGDNFVLRRDIVKATYDAAVAAGDKNVYFIDGSSYFEGFDREICTIDRTHPNDLGHYLMAKRIAREIEKITGMKAPAGR